MIMEKEKCACESDTKKLAEKQVEDITTIHEIIARMNSSIVDHSKYLQFLRDQPEIYYCAYQHFVYSKTSVITYDSIFYSRSNQDVGGLDISSGLFTAGYPGTYTVTWSLTTQLNA